MCMGAYMVTKDSIIGDQKAGSGKEWANELLVEDVKSRLATLAQQVSMFQHQHPGVMIDTSVLSVNPAQYANNPAALMGLLARIENARQDVAAKDNTGGEGVLGFFAEAVKWCGKHLGMKNESDLAKDGDTVCASQLGELSAKSIYNNKLDKKSPSDLPFS